VKKLLAYFAFIALLTAQEHHHAEALDAQQLGIVSFPVSCAPSIRAPFERGIPLLHSFGYKAAQAQFQQIQNQDPTCAMAYWGEAMSLHTQLWDRPSKSDLQKGLALIRKAQSAAETTAREQGYIRAAAAFYG
jgi:hypothetical protein